MALTESRIRQIIAEESSRLLREGSEDEDLMMKIIEAQREIADDFRSFDGDTPDPIDNVRQDIHAVVSKVNDEAERVGFDVEKYMEALKDALEEKGITIEFRIDDYSDRPLTGIDVISGDSDDDYGDEEDEDMDESNLNEGMTFRISPDMPPEILRNLRPGDKIPAEYLIPSSLSPEEGPGAEEAMAHRRPRIIGMKGLGDYEPSSDWEEEEDLDEARKRGKSVVKKGGKKASAGSIATFKKAAGKKKGGETKKKHAGFDAVKKSAEKWGAKNPAAVAQAATMVTTGEPVVAKGEKRKVKEGASSIHDLLAELAALDARWSER